MRPADPPPAQEGLPDDVETELAAALPQTQGARFLPMLRGLALRMVAVLLLGAAAFVLWRTFREIRPEDVLQAMGAWGWRIWTNPSMGSCLVVGNSSGAPAPCARGPASATGRQATATHSSSSSSARAIRSGWSGRGPSPCTPSLRAGRIWRPLAGGAIRFGPATWAWRRSFGIASMARPVSQPCMSSQNRAPKSGREPGAPSGGPFRFRTRRSKAEAGEIGVVL